MKSLEELTAIREKVLGQINMRHNKEDGIKVVVGMATCGIAAGARPVLNAFVEECAKRKLLDVTVTQTGCSGMCKHEPVVEVYVPGKEKVTYIEVDAQKVAKIVSEHIVDGNVCKEYTLDGADK